MADAVLSKTETKLENEADVKGKIALIERTAIREANLNWEEAVQRASASGAIGVMFVNVRDERRTRMPATEDSGYKSEIPVLMISSSGGARLRGQGGALKIKNQGTMVRLV